MLHAIGLFKDGSNGKISARDLRLKVAGRFEMRADLNDVDMTGVMGSSTRTDVDGKGNDMHRLIETYGAQHRSSDVAAYVKAIRMKKTYLNILDGAVAARELGVSLRIVEIVETTGTQLTRRHRLRTLA